MSPSLARVRFVSACLGFLLSSCRPDTQPGTTGPGGEIHAGALTAVSPADISAEQRFAATAPVRLWGRAQQPAAAYGGGVQLVTWAGPNFTRPQAVRLRASDGAPLDPVPISLAGVQDPCGTGMYHTMSAAFAGSQFLVVWAGGSRICGVRLPPAGDVGEPRPFVIAERWISQRATVTTDGTNFFVVWADSSASVGAPAIYDLYGTRIRASDGMVLDAAPIRISGAPGDQLHPSAAFDGANYLVIWNDSRTPYALYGARVRASDAQVLDPDGFLVRQGVLPEARASLAFDGQNYLLVWGANVVQGLRVRASDRMVLDAPTTLTTPVQGLGSESAEPALSYDGSNFLMLWRDRSAPAQDVVQARRFNASMAPVGDVLTVADNLGYFGKPNSSQALSFAEGKHLMLWTQAEPFPNAAGEYASEQQFNLWRSMLDTGGTSGTPAELVAKTAPRQDRPVLSFDGRQHLLAWQEWNGQRFDIRAVRLRDRDGSVLDTTPIAVSATADKNQLFPRVATNGVVHLVVWADTASFRAVRIRGDDGAVLDPQPISLPGFPQVYTHDTPRWAVASDGTNFFVAWMETGGPAFGDPVRLRGVRVRASDGAVLDAAALPLADDQPFRTNVRLAFAGSHYVLVWTERAMPNSSATNILAQRLDPAGARVGPVVTMATPVNTGYNWPSGGDVVGAGDVALVFWEWTYPHHLRGRRLRVSDGTILDTDELAITPANLGTWASWHRKTVAIFDGEHFLFVWSTSENSRYVMRLSRLTPGGQLLDSNGILLSGTYDWPDHDATISGASTGRVLLGYIRHVPLQPFGDQRVHWKWIGQAFSPPDAAVPPIVDAAVPPVVDAAVPPVVDATASPDLPPDAPGPVPADGPIDAGTPVDAPVVTADAPVPVTPDANEADVASPSDGTDGAAPGDGQSAETFPGQPDARLADARPTDAGADGARDARGDAGNDGDGDGCTCQLTGPSRPSGSFALLVGVGLLVRLRRRSRSVRRP